ncbi:MAG: KEOPS complex subunit Pcc1 [Nitrososphaerales archaeon]
MRYALKEAKLKLELSFPSEKEARAILDSLAPELGKGRCKVELRLEKRKSHYLLIDFTSSDLASLRASFNANLRLVTSAKESLRQISENVHRKTEKSGSGKLNTLAKEDHI